MKVEKRAVFCRNCYHDFDSEAANPRCWKCRSRKVSNVEDVPKQYAKKDLEIVKLEIIELNKSKELYLKIFEKLIGRIEVLERK